MTYNRPWKIKTCWTIIIPVPKKKEHAYAYDWVTKKRDRRKLLKSHEIMSVFTCFAAYLEREPQTEINCRQVSWQLVVVEIPLNSMYESEYSTPLGFAVYEGCFCNMTTPICVFFKAWRLKNEERIHATVPFSALSSSPLKYREQQRAPRILF